MGSSNAPMNAAAGIVVTHASAMSRTISQPTCRQRPRPIPIPTTDEETTWVVLTGAPTSDAARITVADVVWLMSPSRLRSGKMRRPMVRTIAQPPSAVPTVSATAQRTTNPTFGGIG